MNSKPSIYPGIMSRSFASAVALWFALGSPCRAQKPDPLATHVQLQLGRTTLGKAANSIAKQTGLDVEPADFLTDHPLSVEMDGLSARDALDALAQIGGWEWRLAPPKKIIIYKRDPAAVRPGEIKDLPAAMRQALTPDMRLFLCINFNKHTVTATDIQDHYQLAFAGGKSRVMWRRTSDKITSIGNMITKRLVDTLLTNHTSLEQASNQELTKLFTDLSNQQSEDVCAALMLYELQTCMMDSRKEYFILAGELTPYETDPGCLQVRLDGKQLGFKFSEDRLVDGRMVHSEQGFGWNISR